MALHLLSLGRQRALPSDIVIGLHFKFVLVYVNIIFFFTLIRASIHRFTFQTFDEILQTAIVGDIVEKMIGEN